MQLCQLLLLPKAKRNAQLHATCRQQTPYQQTPCSNIQRHGTLQHSSRLQRTIDWTGYYCAVTTEREQSRAELAHAWALSPCGQACRTSSIQDATCNQ
jgi:hypothetical protein